MLSSLGRSTAALLVTVIAAAAFWSTAYPTITWWNSAEYSLAAGTLGVVGPPGSLLLTLLGWPFAHLPVGSSPAHVLNLLAGVLAAVTTGLVCVIVLRLLRFTRRADADHDWDRPAALGAALGALTFAFGSTLWEYAVQFTPYILAALFTALILWTMLRWWEDVDNPDAWRRLSFSTRNGRAAISTSARQTAPRCLPRSLPTASSCRPRTGTRSFPSAGRRDKHRSTARPGLVAISP